MIRLNNIVVKFGDFTALHDINVHVKEGEFFTFLGPSGCGKTTTLRTITGFIEPAEGQVFVRDREFNDFRYAINGEKLEKLGIHSSISEESGL